MRYRLGPRGFRGRLYSVTTMTVEAILRHLAFAVLLALFSAGIVRAMIAVRVMDTPEARKAHDRPTPKGGGVGIVLAFLVGIAILYRVAEFARLADPDSRGGVEASVATAAVAIIDGLYDWLRIAQLAAPSAQARLCAARGRGCGEGGRPTGTESKRFPVEYWAVAVGHRQRAGVPGKGGAAVDHHRGGGIRPGLGSKAGGNR